MSLFEVDCPSCGKHLFSDDPTLIPDQPRRALVLCSGCNYSGTVALADPGDVRPFTESDRRALSENHPRWVAAVVRQQVVLSWLSREHERLTELFVDYFAQTEENARSCGWTPSYEGNVDEDMVTAARRRSATDLVNITLNAEFHTHVPVEYWRRMTPAFSWS